MSQESPFIRWSHQAKEWLQNVLGARPAGNGATPSDQPANEHVVQPAAPPPDLSGLEKQVAKLGREQFKLNAMLEAQQQQVQAALQQLREQDERREKERADALARRQAEQAEARLQVIQRLLPVMDGLDEALAAGERLLERAPSPLQMQEIGKLDNAPLPWWQVLAAWPLFLIGLVSPRLAGRRQHRRQIVANLSTDMAAWEDAQIAWLRGLELVRERLLETLAVEGVEPVETVGRLFDPHRHAAVDTAPAGPDAPPGTIVSELRRGYIVGSRVLRYAEVVVARE